MAPGPPSLASERTLAALLAERTVLPTEEALVIISQVTQAVQALHRAGLLQRTLTPESIRLDTQGKACLADSDPPLIADDDALPPEIRTAGLGELPRAIDAAHDLLKKRGLTCDPRRIDVYQIGVLLCRLLTGESAEVYLRSPRAKAKVPPNLQTILDQCLGYDDSNRLMNCDDLLVVLQTAECRPSPSFSKETPRFADTPSDILAARADTSLFLETPPRGGEPPRNNADPACLPLPFATLGHYQIVERIGQGGMGEVYKGYEALLERTVAVKVLPEELARHADFVRRFHAEASAAARLAHPNIIQIYFVGEDRGRHFFAMQYVEGESLAELLQRRQRLSVDETVAIVEQCLAGLAAAHEKGLVHRDIKPGNILLDRRHKRALLADFGLVKAVDRSGRLTATGTILGTVDYISPEQVRGLPVDGRADLYALGVLCYQMLSGRLPFQADSSMAMLFQHAYEQPPPLALVAPTVPAELARLVDRLLAKDPNLRCQTAQEVLAELRSFRTVGRLESDPKPELPRRTAIIEAPVFDWEPELPAEIRANVPAHYWSRFHDWLFGLLRAHAPEIVQRLQSTTQQMDGAVAEYQRRRDQLHALVVEAEQIAADLSQEARDRRAAALEAARQAEGAGSPEDAEQQFRAKAIEDNAAVELEKQGSAQREQLEEMRLRLAKIDAALHQVRNQRDVLQARLRAAQARLVVDGVRNSPRQRRRLTWLVVSGLVVFFVSLLAIMVMAMIATRQPTGVSSAAKGPVAQRKTPEPPTPVEATPPGKPLGQLYLLRDHPGAVVSVSFSFNDFGVLSGDREGTILFRNLESQNIEKRIDLASPLSTVSFSPDGASILYATAQLTSPRNKIGFRALRDTLDTLGRDLFEFEVPTKSINGAVYSKDGHYVLLGGEDGFLRVWEEKSRLEIAKHDATTPIRAVAFAPGADRALAGGDDRSVLLWDILTRKVLHQMGGHLARVTSVAFSTDGTRAASGSADQSVRVWNLDTGKEVLALTGHVGSVNSVALSRDGKLAVSGGDDNSVRVWNLASGLEQSRFTGHTAPVNSVAFSFDGNRAASGSDDRTVRVWDLRVKPRPDAK